MIRRLRVKWRKYGALMLITPIIVGAILHNHLALFICMSLLLTVPCGRREFNTNIILHSLRQLAFYSIALVEFGLYLRT